MKFDLYNAPEDYINLKEELLKILLQKVSKHISLQKFSGLYRIKLYKLLKLSCNKNRRKNILISDLRKILDFLLKKENKDLHKFVENRIFSIGRFQTILKPKFPIDFTTSYAVSILADILTDGAFCTKGDVIYSNTNIREVKNNIKNINLIFCGKEIKYDNLEDIIRNSYVRCKVYKRRDGYMIVKYPVSVGKYLKSIGMIPGKRVYTDPSIPQTVFESSIKTKKIFLERVIINEGYVSPKAITIMHSKDCSVDDRPPKLLTGYKMLFNNLGIKTSRIRINHYYYTKSGNKRVAWAIHVTGQSLSEMMNKFRLNDKQPYLEMRRDVETQLPSDIRKKQILEILKRKALTTREIANILNLSHSSVRSYTKLLWEKGLIRRKMYKTTFINSLI